MSAADATRPRLLAAALVAVALLVGLLGGIVLERLVLHPGGRVGALARPSAPTRPAPSVVRGRFERQLAADLRLSPEQRARVDTLLSRQQDSSRAVMRTVAPRLRGLAAATDSGLRAILTPEQWERFEARRKATRQERIERFRERRTGGTTTRGNEHP